MVLNDLYTEVSLRENLRLKYFNRKPTRSVERIYFLDFE